MPNYGDVVRSLKGVYVSALNTTTNTYGTPAQLEYVQDASDDPQTDTDEIKSEGMAREMLAVTTKIDLKLKEASMKDDAVSILTGESATESGASGNRQRTRDTEGAGAGNPYVGVIMVFNATNGAIYVAGYAKTMAKNKPKFSAEQNKFRTGEIEFSAIATTSTVNKIRRTRKYESASDVPDFTSASAWNTFFTGMFS